MLKIQHNYSSALRDLGSFCEPKVRKDPKLVFFNHPLAQKAQFLKELSIRDEGVLANELGGGAAPSWAKPFAQAYAGHQFGHFVPSLGDGRALILGEFYDQNGILSDLSLKGSGRTPYSRSGDGNAALGPMLREALMGEFLHAMSIPTTRALSVVSTGEPIYRENVLPGAVLTRIAASHIRVGSFEYFVARGEEEKLRRLAIHTMHRHYPGLVGDEAVFLDLLVRLMNRQASLIAQWMGVGFIHGVMNTDNMSLSGETIDFGPCAFMENYDPRTVFSSIDHGGRYSYHNQPKIAQWNLARFAETLIPLHENPEEALKKASQIIENFPALYNQWSTAVFAKKMALGHLIPEPPGTPDLMEILLGDSDPRENKGNSFPSAVTEIIGRFLTLLERENVDFTQAFSSLSEVGSASASKLEDLFLDRPAVLSWLKAWEKLQASPSIEESSVSNHLHSLSQMKEANPLVIPRNQRVEEALSAAHQGDLDPFHRLIAALRSPKEIPDNYFQLYEPSDKSFNSSYQTFCGT